MPPRKVLVVEDDDAIRAGLIQYLREHGGFEMESARDGVEALHQVASTQYGLVILDLMMPHMTGIDFLDSLQAMLSDPSVKSIEGTPAVVIVTGASDEHVSTVDLERRFPELVRVVLRKPVELRRLAAAVEVLLG